MLTLANRPAHAVTLFDELGGQPGIARIVESAVTRNLADPRVRDAFDNTNIDRLKRQLATQFCELTDGPCRYTGQTMKGSHAHLGLRMRDLNALVENFQAALDEQNIPFRVQNRFLALLAPMRRDIVTK